MGMHVFWSSWVKQWAEACAGTQVVVRGAHDCWVVAKRAAARTIVVVLEGRGEDDVLGAAASADRFIEKHFEGLLQ